MGAFSIEHTIQNRYIHCVVTGAVLTTSYKQLYDGLERALKKCEGVLYFVVDYSHVTMFTSTCINVLITLQENITANGYELVLISTQNDINDILDITGFTQVYPVYDSMQLFLQEKAL